MINIYINNTTFLVYRKEEKKKNIISCKYINIKKKKKYNHYINQGLNLFGSLGNNEALLIFFKSK